ncbi:MAG: tetratricopeptide repeat protein [Proteobacteria bacterium]|nr:MAG: tetratricopeptide repeat protein [Pseudomonadota bacterium]
MKVESSKSILTVLKIAFVTFLMVVLVGDFALAAEGGNVSVAVSRIGDASHLEFSGAADWKYDLRKDDKGGVVLNLAGLKPDALAKLRQINDPVIKGVKIQENGVDGAIQISFATAPGSDFFDYITEQPSRLIVDFFPKEASDTPAAPVKVEKKPVAAKTASTKKKPAPADSDDEDEDEDASNVASNGSVKDITTAITGRKPAGNDFPLMAKTDPNAKPSLAEEISGAKGFEYGIFDGGDPEFKRFTIRDYEVSEDSIFKSKGNFYLPFPMLDLGNPQLKALIDAPPSYEIVPNDTRENKEARIILTLFNTGKRALFLTTAGDFLKKYPDSQYDEIIRYMMADTFEKQWREKGQAVDFETAMGSYQSLTEKYPKSPVSARTLLFMGYSYVERGDSFAALKAFQRFTRTNPTSKHLDQVNIASAEAYLKLNRFEDSMKTLEDIEANGKTAKVRQEASFRKGDISFRKKDYDTAIKLYRDSIKKFPDSVQKFPNAYYNIAESQFTKGQYREALESYRAFLVKFPDHLHGGYAMTRLGELLGILGADSKRAQGAFMESFFRFRSTPGAGIARIRSLVTRMPEMKDKELGSSLKEIATITERYANRPKSDRKPASDVAAVPAKEGEHAAADAHGEVAAEEPAGENLAEKKPELPGIEEFTTLLLADGYNSRHEYEKAAKDLIAYYQKNPQSNNKDRITSRIKKNIADDIGSSVAAGNFMAALRDYSKNSNGWLKNTDRIDVRYAVGRAYEQAGVFKEAAAAYQDSLKRRDDLKKSGQEREHAIYEDIPKADQIQLRLAAVAAKQKDFSSSETSLKAISTPSQLNDVEQIERAEVAADVAEARGQAGTAEKYLSDLLKVWKGDVGLTAPLHLRIAKVQGAAKNFKVAEQHLSKILEMKNENESVSDSSSIFVKVIGPTGCRTPSPMDGANA